ncbi:hypothetical protein [Hyphomicrobium sp.]|uniref:hypothetical protein n=1 Tax=Hyphomicrobium sp. TaxID=82 RepID=UPI002FE3E2ED
MHRSTVAASMLAFALAGCSSSGNGVSTASILGGAPTPPAAADAAPAAAQTGGATVGQAGGTVAPVAVAPASTPTDRALQVGTVSARAVKCGYNFDAPRLKSTYLAHEASLGASSDQLAQVEKIYNVGYNGVTKAAATEPDYCSDRKTQTIKADLGRLLAGDFEPPAKKVVAKQDGFFDGWFDGASNPEEKFGGSDWWEKQAAKAGK